MMEIHLYGKLRRFCEDQAANADSILRVPHASGDTVSSVVARLGIPLDELGSNLFIDGHYANLESPVPDGARLGLFPDDMQLLYKWYFNPSPAGTEGNK
jgi:hypothetical protein